MRDGNAGTAVAQPTVLVLFVAADRAVDRAGLAHGVMELLGVLVNTNVQPAPV